MSDVNVIIDDTGTINLPIIDDGDINLTISGITSFLPLTDTPSSYSGQAAKAVLVKATEDGLEFGTAAGGASFTYKERILGEVFTGNLGYFVIPDELDTKLIKEVRIAVLGLPTGQALKVDIRKNGTPSTDSIFTSDVPIEIGTGQSATNGVFQTGCDESGSTIGSAGTTLNSGEITLSADDVLYIYCTQTGSAFTGADLVVEIIIG